MEPIIRKALKKYDENGLFCYYVSAGGGVREVLRDLNKALLELEAEGARLGIIAEGRFPMFERGSVCLFHNDHCEWEIVRCQHTYGSEPEWGKGKRLKPANQNYWEDLESIADIMSVLVKRPNTLAGGDPTKY